MFDWERRTQIILMVLVGAILFGVGYKYAKVTSASQVEITQEQDGQGEGGSKIYIHIAGAVEKPGVYLFDDGARVNDAVTKAVPMPEADMDRMNLAALLEDGQRIEVPAKEVLTGEGLSLEGMASAPGLSSKLSDGTSGTININSATAEELDTLPGIGPAYAERIIAYREEHGGFSDIEELQEVSGIGPKTYEKLKDMVSIY